jgi:hypothetical protein
VNRDPRPRLCWLSSRTGTFGRHTLEQDISGGYPVWWSVSQADASGVVYTAVCDRIAPKGFLSLLGSSGILAIYATVSPAHFITQVPSGWQSYAHRLLWTRRWCWRLVTLLGQHSVPHLNVCGCVVDAAMCTR